MAIRSATAAEQVLIDLALSRGGHVGKSAAETLTAQPSPEMMQLAMTPPELLKRVKPPLRGERQLSVSLQLPWPPSVNNLFVNAKNGRVPSKRAKVYRLDVAQACFEQDAGHVVGNHLMAEIWAYPPDNRRRDLDNLWKAILDGLQSAGVFEDDGQFSKLTINRGAVGEGVVNVSIYGSTPAEEKAGW